jgi:hypothetical protein
MKILPGGGVGVLVGVGVLGVTVCLLQLFLDLLLLLDLMDLLDLLLVLYFFDFPVIGLPFLPPLADSANLAVGGRNLTC